MSDESPQPIAVATSDCHLQERAWSSRQDLSNDAFHSFAYIVDYALERGLPIIGAGDLIDKQKNASSVPGFLRRQLDICQNADSPIPFYYVQGQHELQPCPWFSEISSWPTWLPDTGYSETSTVRVGGHYLWGIDWTPAGELAAKLEEVPDTVDILVMHQVCAEFMGSITSPELDWHMIPGNVSMLIVGDYHKQHVQLQRENAAGHPLRILCPGSTCMQSIDEPPDKSFFVIYEDLSVESVSIPARRVLAPPVLRVIEDLDGFVESVESRIDSAVKSAEELSLPAALCKPILYVKYDWGLPDAYKRIMKAVDGRAHVFLKEIRQVSKEQVESRKERKKILEGGLLGSLPDMAQDKKSARYKISHRLLSAKNPREELSKIRKEYLDAEG